MHRYFFDIIKFYIILKQTKKALRLRFYVIILFNRVKFSFKLKVEPDMFTVKNMDQILKP